MHKASGKLYITCRWKLSLLRSGVGDGGRETEVLFVMSNLILSNTFSAVVYYLLVRKTPTTHTGQDKYFDT